jgi:hypothetical protein
MSASIVGAPKYIDPVIKWLRAVAVFARNRLSDSTMSVTVWESQACGTRCTC